MNLDSIVQSSILNSESLLNAQSAANDRSSSSNGTRNPARQHEDHTPPREKRMRGAAWRPWEDRALARQVLADDPILGQVGRKEDRWEEVSNNLTHYGMSRSWSSCKDRMEKLVHWHKAADTRSKQKSGTDEEVTDHIERLDDITLRYESLSKNAEIKQDAKKKIEKKREDGKKLRECSLEGLVRKRALETNDTSINHGQQRTDIDEEVTPTHFRKRTKQAKNEFAKEVAGVVDGLHEKASELRKKIEEKEEQERARAAEQRELGKKMDMLIDSNQRTNEAIQLLLQTLTSRN